MNMMLQPNGMAPAIPMPMPSPEEIEQAQQIIDACTWEEISGILRSDERRSYSIDVETDATAFEDEETEKQQRIEFMGAMTTWLQSAIPAVQSNPTLAPLMKELTMFSVGAFKIGRTLEEAFEDAFDQVKNAPPQPDPESEKLKAEMAMKEKELQATMAGKQADAQLKAQESQQKMAFEQQRFGLEQKKMELELQFKQQEMGFKERELQMKQSADAFNMDLQAQNARFDQGLKWQDAQDRRASAQLDRQTAMEDRQVAAEDRQFQRGMAERDMAGKEQERSIKQQDMQERRAMDQEDRSLRRDVESTALQKRAEKHAAALDLQEHDKAFNQIRKEMSEAFGVISDQQMQISEALQAIIAQQEETSQAVTAVISHITAPRKILRDGTGKAVDVEIGENSLADLKEGIARLGAKRKMYRGADNRIESFA